jgi:hypothetical protein
MAELKGVYITDIDGNAIEVTDIDAALAEARGAVRFNEEKIRRHKTNPEEIIFPQALKNWKHILLELELVEMKCRRMQKEQAEAVEKVGKEEGPGLPPAVIEARRQFANRQGDAMGFIRNDCSSPLYGVASNWLFMDNEIALRMLKVGESTRNSSGTKITRVF